MEGASVVDDLLERLWRDLGGRPEALAGTYVSGPDRVLRSLFDVTGLAGATVAVANLAAAEFLAARGDGSLARVDVDRRAACAAFRGEALFAPEGWRLPPAWDPIAGDYRTADGWVRLHTNYRHHRAAVEHVLGAGDRESVAGAVLGWPAAAVESSIVDAGGCAAVMYDRPTWIRHPAGAVTVDEPVVRLDTRPAATPPRLAAPPGADPRPFAGVRVLDLTRVIAGPVCTRFLAAHGAEVLRIDPPGFDEVAAVVPETTAGKRCARLDLTAPADRTVFEGLVTGADVLVSGLRPGALSKLGYDEAVLCGLNPSLVRASLDAYGFAGGWAGRRGFDSLVQMSCGIAAAAGQDRPVPLPAQALDHGTGYLLAAAVGRAMTRLVTDGRASHSRCSLVGTANVLMDHPTPDGLDDPDPAWSTGDTEATSTAWGPARRVPVPGSIAGVTARLTVDAGPLGRHAASW